MHASNAAPGFIALISAIVVSFVLLLAVVTVGMRGITGRLYLLQFENKQASQALAESCVNLAFIGIANDPSYSASNVSVPIGQRTCTILSVTSTGGVSTIKASGVVQGATTYLLVTANSNTVAIASWAETPTAP